MFDNHNSNNGQRPTRCKFGLKFTPKPVNPELSVQENIMNFINDYRQWEKDNPQPDYSHLSTREAVKRIVEDFRTQEREEEEQKAMQAQMQRPYGSGQTSYAPAQGFYGTQQNANMSPQRSYVPAGQATYGATGPNGAAASPYLEFDGEQLSWYENNQKKKSWKAMSGQPAYQCAEYQNVPNSGPIPEGTWQVKQSNYQNFDDLSMNEMVISQAGTIAKIFGKQVGKWPGGTWAWGKHRVWLEPKDETNTHGRTRITIHGGSDFGSAGCIDLADGMDDFAQDYKKYGKDMPLTVKYPKKCW